MDGSTDVFAIGDTANAVDRLGSPLPALAQVAKQQGAYLGDQLERIIAGQSTRPFEFRNRGNTAVVGRHAAVFDFGRWKLKGTFAWFLWAVVHVLLLVNFEKRILVSVQWVWRYATKQRGARLIDENAFEEPNRVSQKDRVGGLAVLNLRHIPPRARPRRNRMSGSTFTESRRPKGRPLKTSGE
jgi:NADH dehydrogenase